MDQIAKLQKQIAQLVASNKELKQRIAALEQKVNQTTDYRYKDNVRHVLGFSLSDVRGYFHAVKTVDGEQMRIYIGKDGSEENVRKKIIKCIVDNFRFYKNQLKHCEELAAEPAIAALLGKDGQK